MRYLVCQGQAYRMNERDYCQFLSRVAMGEAPSKILQDARWKMGEIEVVDGMTPFYAETVLKTLRTLAPQPRLKVVK